MVAAKNNINLTGRSAVVTGGAQGIGYAVAQRLLQSGAAVSLWDMDAALLKSASAALGKEGAVSSVQVDVANPESVVDAVKASQAAMGTIEIMVACAGIAGPTVPSWEYPIADWQRVIDIDLNGVYYCCREVLPLMRAELRPHRQRRIDCR
jgi:NAD(P)-dependent dehydrogenase (short-subunit alcohol dehydrogenase family)